MTTRTWLLSFVAAVWVAAMILFLERAATRGVRRSSREGAAAEQGDPTANASPRTVAASSPHRRPAPQWPAGEEFVEDFDEPLIVYESVFWDEGDTESLRQLIRGESLVRGKSVLEIGTGSGLLSLCCLKAGAARVVATDINPAALDNALDNARRLGLEDRLTLRLVPLSDAGAFSVIAEGERFDLIISNPPWEDDEPGSMAEYALYDPGFALLDSLLSGLTGRLTPDGKCLLAYGNVTAIRRVYELAERYGLHVRTLDERDLSTLPETFLPGMLLEVTPATR